jgi:hypothetical protein
MPSRRPCFTVEVFEAQGTRERRQPHWRKLKSFRSRADAEELVAMLLADGNGLKLRISET